MRLRLRIVTALALLIALAAPGLAHASGSAVVHECTVGSIKPGHSQKDFADALANLPADVDEYTDCRDQIRRAQLGGGGGGSTGGGAGGGGGTSGAAGGGTGGGTAGGTGNGDTGTAVAPGADPLGNATPQERASFQKAIDTGSAPVQLDGRPVSPGSLGGAKSSGLTDLPTPLLAMLALLAIGGLGAAGFGTRRLVHGRRPA
jgi:hypothetical protein